MDVIKRAVPDVDPPDDPVAKAFAKAATTLSSDGCIRAVHKEALVMLEKIGFRRQRFFGFENPSEGVPRSSDGSRSTYFCPFRGGIPVVGTRKHIRCS